MSNNQHIELISQIDTERFGFKIAKMSDPKLINFETLTLLRKNQVKLIISRVPSEDIPLINQMEKWGFRLKDIQLTYKFDFSKTKIDYHYLNKEITIREAVNSDIKNLEKIARDCFLNYGHYFANDRLDKQKIIDSYADWTSRSYFQKEKKDLFLVAEMDKRILGFLNFREHKMGEIIYSSGGIGAVDKNIRSKNVFSSICIKGLEWSKLQNHKWQEHNVLNINYPVNRAFSKLGFSNQKSEVTMHLWMNELNLSN